MFQLLRKLFTPNVQPMNKIIISKKNILRNLSYLQSLQSNIQVFPVLKSNAYWHGLKQITKILNKTDVPYLAVDSYPEYIIIKKNSKKQILLLGETLDKNYKKFDYKRVTFCVWNESTIQYLGKLNKKIRIHLFLNTWMNREWIDQDYLDQILELLKQYPRLQVTWILSHLHSADSLSDKSIKDQIQIFKKMYYKIIDSGHTPLRRHIWNSAWILKIEDDFFNSYRPWLALYGYNPLDKQDPKFNLWEKLKPALSIVSRITSIHQLDSWESLSYNSTYTAIEKQKTATIPFGYSEWLPRVASNKLIFKIRENYIRQIWTICMNMCCIQADPLTQVGEEIELVSEDPKSKNSLINLAEQSNTIIYEILVKLDKSIRREID